VKLKALAPFVATVIAVDLGELDLNRAAETLGIKSETLNSILAEGAELRERHAEKKIGKPQRQPETSAEVHARVGDRLKAKILAGISK
jgi:hypothetical protein